MRRAIHGTLLAAITFCSACGDGPEERSQTLAGIAAVDQPLVGATVSVIGPDGSVLFSEEADTHVTGAFVIDLPAALPADFELTVTGGTVGEGGPAFTGILRRDVESHLHAHYGFYSVDPVSTLVAAYRRASPGRTLEEAHAAVWAFLDLPAEVDEENDLHFRTDLFDPALFMGEAAGQGGLDAFVARLVEDVDAQDDPPCFSARCLGMPGGMASAAAGAVAKGALSYFGQEAAGWAMKEAFGWGDASEQDRAAIQASLAQQATLLYGVIAELHSLETAMSAAKNEILAELAATRYGVKSDTLIPIRSFAEARYEELYLLTLAHPGDGSYQNLVSELARRLTDRDLAADLLTVHNTLVSSAPGEQGLLDIWGSIQHGKGITSERYPQLAAQLSYWFDVQVHLLQLRLEYLHFTYPTDTSMAQATLASFDTRLAAQTDAFLAWAESLAYVDYTLQQVAGFPYWDRLRPFCVPDQTVPHLLEADRLVGGMLGRDPALVVRLYLQAPLLISGTLTLENVELQLENQATHEVTAVMPQVAPLTVWHSHGMTVTAQIGRYIATDLPSGTYKIVDTNAAHPTYGTTHNPLLNPETLDAVMSLTADAPSASIAGFVWNRHWLNGGTSGCGAHPY